MPYTDGGVEDTTTSWVEGYSWPWRGCVNSACFLDVIWYEAVKEVLGEEEGIEGEEGGSELEAAGHGGVVRWVEGL